MEIWRDIPGFVGYQVSNLGHVRSFWSHKGYSHHYYVSESFRPLTQRSDRWGRPMVTMRQNGKTITRMVHRLVMLAFRGPCPAGYEVCHNNGDASDNDLRNLRYDTPIRNHADKYRHGTMPQGEKHYRARLTDEDIRNIRRRRLAGERPGVLAAEYGVRPSHISHIMRGDTWSHIL